MVLQKAPEGCFVGLWTDDAEVTVFLSGGPVTNNAPTVSVAAGKWRMTLVPMEAGGPYNLTAVLQNNHGITLTDVLFGDVWLCGGQGNMAFTTSLVFNVSEELARVSKFPQVRIFMAALEQSDTELTDLAGVEVPWSVPTAKAWSSPRALQHCDLDRINGFPMPYTPSMYLSKRTNSVLWNAMIHPLLNMTIKGAIWYQGKTAWGLYIYPEVSTYRKASLSEGFPNIRWHQTADYGFAPNLRMKNTFMAVAMDLGDEMSPFGSIHPRDKQDVAYRLSLGARAVAYGEEGVSFQGPFPRWVLVNDQYINVTYDQSVCHSFERYFSAGLRYAWRDWPCDFKACPVYSADGVLPAPPFTPNRWPDKQ
uniref:sialate O-acetylesterase-like n=1 Tax=Oncorhynchus gorbuscha TaxID=8017 RepID=UPI001EAF125E|nr:sialate O-acetylesterase-like [Oncorhynchus gorbuscha]